MPVLIWSRSDTNWQSCGHRLYCSITSGSSVHSESESESKTLIVRQDMKIIRGQFADFIFVITLKDFQFQPSLCQYNKQCIIGEDVIPELKMKVKLINLKQSVQFLNQRQWITIYYNQGLWNTINTTQVVPNRNTAKCGILYYTIFLYSKFKRRFNIKATSLT